MPDLLAAMHALTGGLVVVTDGADGASATADDRVRARLAGLTGNFPVGSGDSFLGGLLVALDRGDDLGGALALATATGTANAHVPGAVSLDPTLARCLASEVEVTAVGRSEG